MRYFFFGTLMDPELRTAVLGRALDEAALKPAWIEGYRRCHVAGEAFPLLVPSAGATVDGVLASGLSETEAARIGWYESDDYDIAEIEICVAADRRATAFCCLPRPTARSDGTPWSFERWRERDRAFALRLARDWMACFGSADVDLAEHDYRRRKMRLLGRDGAEVD